MLIIKCYFVWLLIYIKQHPPNNLPIVGEHESRDSPTQPPLKGRRKGLLLCRRTMGISPKEITPIYSAKDAESQKAVQKSHKCCHNYFFLCVLSFCSSFDSAKISSLGETAKYSWSFFPGLCCKISKNSGASGPTEATGVAVWPRASGYLVISRRALRFLDTFSPFCSALSSRAAASA